MTEEEILESLAGLTIEKAKYHRDYTIHVTFTNGAVLIIPSACSYCDDALLVLELKAESNCESSK